MELLASLAYLLSLFGSLLGLDSVLNDIDNPPTANQEWLIGRLLPLRQEFQQLTLDLVISPAHPKFKQAHPWFQNLNPLPQFLLPQ